MAGETKNAILSREVQTLFGFGVVRDASDRQLLERFLAADHVEAEAAFTFLVERHGPMVLHVCRQVLDDSHDAQDAFQATFLVLLRRGGVDPQARLARELALWRGHAGGAGGRDMPRSQGGFMSDTPASWRQPPLLRSAATPSAWRHCTQEIARLPARYREPIVLCHLEGLSTAAAAQRLGCPQGTILSRLARGRQRLRRRLVERGLALPAGLLAASLMPQETAAALPAALVTSTVRLAAQALAGRAALAAAVSLSVSALTEATHEDPAHDPNHVCRGAARDGRRRGRPDHSLHPPDHGRQLARRRPSTRDRSRPIKWLIKTPWLDAISTCSRAPGIASRRRSKARRCPLRSTASRSHPKTPRS